MSNTIEYKAGDIDTIGAIIIEDGNPMDLSDATVSFIMKKDSQKITLVCDLGGFVNGIDVLAIDGGVTINVTSDATATPGQYQGEFLITKDGYIAHAPSGNNFITVTIWAAL